MSDAATIYDLAGGEDAFVALVESFYARVEQDPLLRPVYPADLEPGKRRLALFLAQYWGGPRRYERERGHPRLRRRHAPFTITPAAAERWAELMSDAIREQHFPPRVEQALLDYVARFTPSMVNTPDEPVVPEDGERLLPQRDDDGS